MARVAVRESVTLTGRAARAFLSEVLGPGHPCGDVAILLFSEVFDNSVRHPGSGETVTAAVRAGDGVVRVEVTDRAGPRTPELRLVDRDAEGGRGLQLVAGLHSGQRRADATWPSPGGVCIREPASRPFQGGNYAGRIDYGELVACVRARARYGLA
jgi:hypothetical protein